MRSLRLPEHEVEQYVVLLKLGSVVARDRLIESHVPLILGIAKSYVKRHPDLGEEIISAALENLTKKVERIRTGDSLTENNNIGAFLNKSTTLAIKHYLRKVQQLKQRTDLMITNLPQRRTYNDAVEHLLLDEIFSSTEFNDVEKKIIHMRLGGYTDEEIASEVGITQQRVCAIRHKMRPRLDLFI